MQSPKSSQSLSLRFRTIVLAFCMLVVGSTAFAQVSSSEVNALAREAAAARETALANATKPGEGVNFFSLLVKGGVFMIPLAMVSLMVVTFVFDRLIGLRQGRLLPGKFRNALLKLARQGELDPRAVYKLCGEYPSAAATVVRAMVLQTGRPQSELQSAVSEATQREADRAYGNVRWLNLAAGIGPLLGLLGTVWGLIQAFHDTTKLASGQSRADFLAIGIYEALVTTLAGLMVAIPATVASHYFEARITRMFGNIEELAAELMPRLERYEGRTRFEPIGRELVARELFTTTTATTLSPHSIPARVKA